jgi:Carboxypeptidase regulatory-like domain/TonB-dependent Receptor Plug Domain
MKWFKASLLIFLAVVFAGTMVIGTAAQTGVTGAVSGTVLDPGGASVPGANVKLYNVGTTETYTAVTDNSGFFTISLVKPGTYTLSVEKAGFRKEERSLAVVVGQNLTSNFKLEVGNVSEVVQVEAAPPQLQVENANLTTTFEADLVSKLPNPGNDLTAVAQTAPGILMNTSNGGGYGNFTAFGLPATSNLFTMNGNDENDPYLNLNNSGASNLLLGTNEVQEVAVVSNGYTGQYGRQAGAQIDYVTKTGTNQFHGNANYFYNNRVMNANDFFNNSSGTPLPTENNNQWQASIGGPIVKDKVFFFADYEGLRYVLGTSNQVIVPTPAFASAVVANLPSFGNVNSGPFYQNMFNLWDSAPGINRAVPVDSSVDGTGNLGCGDMNVVGGFGPGLAPGFSQFGGSGVNPAYSAGTGPGEAAINSGGGTPCSEVFRSNVGALSTEWILAGNVEFHLNDANRVNIRYRMDRGIQPTYTDPINPAFTMTSNQPQYEGQINWNHIFSPTKTNQLIISGMWYSAIFGPQANPAQSLFPGTLENFDTSSWANMGGINYDFPQGRNVSQAQIVDDFTWTKGNHTLQFGGNFRFNKVSDYSNTVLNIPLMLILSTTDFSEGYNDYIRQRHPELLSTSVGIYSLGLYAQDLWKVNANLKLTLALRLDRNSNAQCYQNCYSRFASTFTDLTHDPTIPFSQLFDNNLRSAFPGLQAVNVQPRVGFAWTPNTKYWRSGSTVIRGGVGLFSDLYPATLVDRFMHNSTALNDFTISAGIPQSPAEPGNAYEAQNTCDSIFRGIAGSATGTVGDYATAAKAAGLPCTTPNYNSVNNNIVNPTYIEWNLQVQHAITNRLMFDANYVGNHGYNMFITNPWVNAAGGNLAPFEGLPNVRPDLRVRSVENLTNSGISNYNGVSFSLTERATHGLSFRFNYTYSHTQDDISNGGVLPYSLNDSQLTQMFPTNMSLNYSNSDYDVRHNITANYLWEMPFKSGNKFVNGLIGGWMMSGTIFYRSGLPFSAFDSGGAPELSGGTYGVLLAVPNNVGGLARGCGAAAINTACMNFDQFQPTGSETGFSTIPRNFFRGPGYFNTDFALLKNFAITERTHFAIGANFFNILNHPNFANPTSDISSGELGKIISTVVPPTSPYGAFVGSAVSGRQIQVTARIVF